MRVRPITDDELPDFIAISMREYAEQMRTMGGGPAEDLDRQTEHYFPGGRLSPGHAVLIAEDDDGHRLGRLWMAPRGESTDVAFVYEVQVEEHARGKGYGRQLMREAQQWSRDNGYRTLALHVFGGNDVAITLYESMGFETTDRLMKLDL